MGVHFRFLTIFRLRFDAFTREH